MTADRIAALKALIEKKPDDARLQFGLALELEKHALWQEVAESLTSYLALADDEGNAWGRLASALRKLGRDDDARAAYEKGIEAARSHGHPSMAADFEDILSDWD